VTEPNQERFSRRAVRSFVLRQGRMGSGQHKALAELGPCFVLPYVESSIDLNQAFERDAPKVLEIGFGMGQTTAEIAAANPDRDYLGVEVHTPGVGSLLKLIGEQGLTNIRIIQHDAIEVLEHMIPDASLSGVHVFFPDPWPKKRHHKRRLVQPTLVQLISRKLVPGGYLHCATDWEDYAIQMLEVLSSEKALENTAESYVERPEWRPLTKFEQRGIRLGHGVRDLLFRRRQG
jgi:tRNA (guanine-N7-)-methyltransferase